MNLNTVERYFEAMERFDVAEADYGTILHPEVEQTEYPNGLTPTLTVSDYATLFKRMPQGKALLSSQKYDVRKAYEFGDAVVTEVVWTATVAIEAGPFKPGQALKAYFCCVFEFKDGLIYRQRNYDCFERF